MHAIEFETQAHNGILQIPEQYLAWKNKTVKVILLDTETEQQPRRKVYAHRFKVDSIELPTRDALYER
jgi:hypothetical protein